MFLLVTLIYRKNSRFNKNTDMTGRVSPNKSYIKVFFYFTMITRNLLFRTFFSLSLSSLGLNCTPSLSTCHQTNPLRTILSSFTTPFPFFYLFSSSVVQPAPPFLISTHFTYLPYSLKNFCQLFFFTFFLTNVPSLRLFKKLSLRYLFRWLNFKFRFSFHYC